MLVCLDKKEKRFNQNTNNINQIIHYYGERLEVLHNFFKNYKNLILICKRVINFSGVL